jgi:ubiquitin-protein ligase
MGANRCRVLIIGPQDTPYTPYEDGMFEFDLFCPTAFPQTPPTMMFKGANCPGTSAIDPNLHPDRKGKFE